MLKMFIHYSQMSLNALPLSRLYNKLYVPASPTLTLHVARSKSRILALSAVRTVASTVKSILLFRRASPSPPLCRRPPTRRFAVLLTENAELLDI